MTAPLPADPARRAARGDRAAYLAEVQELLWPGPEPDPAVAGTSGGEFIVLPGLRRPRLLVPPHRRAAAAAVRRYGEPGSARARVATRALSLGLGTGLGRMVLRDRLRLPVPGIESYLREQLGRDVVVSMHLGAARANRKPVLQLLTRDGATVGFAKIGCNPLTRALVQGERDALAQLEASGMRCLAVPRALHFGRWQDLAVLVLSPLPVWQRRTALRPGRLAGAMAEVAGVAGIVRERLAAGGYWAALRQKLASADDTADRRSLAQAVTALGEQAGATALLFGACHGDWTPWNMASTRSGLLVWDWERFTARAPLGFDALHHWLQAQVVARRRDPREAAAECVARAPALLAPFDVGPAEARLTALVYVADLAGRYLADRQAEAGARLGAPGGWLIPALTAGIAEL